MSAGLVERSDEDTTVGGIGHQKSVKHGPSGSTRRRLHTDNDDYLLPMSSVVYLDIIDDTGQWFNELTTPSFVRAVSYTRWPINTAPLHSLA